MPDMIYGLALDANSVVIGFCQSNCAQPGMVAVDADTYRQASTGSWRYVDGALQAYTPPPTPAPEPTVTGNQWAFALNDLGLASAWRVGVAKSKDGDQNRIGLIARDTQLLASDPLLIRVAANAGNDASGNALISVPAVFAHAQGMPT